MKVSNETMENQEDKRNVRVMRGNGGGVRVRIAEEGAGF